MIRNRFLIAMIALSVPPLFVLGYISYNIAKDTLVQNHIQANKDHLKTVNEVADLLFRNIISVGRLVLVDGELREQLRSSGMDETGEKRINVRTVNRLQYVINVNFIDTRYIDSVCLFDRTFRSACYGGSDPVGRYGSADRRGDLANADWYLKSDADGGKIFSYNVLDELQNVDTFSSVKILRDPDNLQGGPLALLVINIKKSLFEDVLNKSDNGGFMVLDDSYNGLHMVYDNNQSVTGGIQLKNDISTTLNKLQAEGYLITRITNQTTGWTFAHVMKTQELLKQSDQIGSATALISSIIALVALLLSLLISSTITRPLLQLKKMMVDWAKGTPSLDKKFEIDEVGTIGETFKKMALENIQLTERLIRSQLKEREAELQALQAQIKPHFLYNTLDSIYWMAVMQNNQDIAHMAVSLSESFKLSLNKGKETIPLMKELKHIEHYLTIQNIRFNNRFSYIEEVEPELLHYEILKLLLQPLVENAIYHGLEPKLGAGTIRLTGRIETGMMIFTIEDNGVGIQSMEVTKQGFGLNNVRERLNLFYGLDSLFTITSQVDKGTKIELRFHLSDRKDEVFAESRHI
jgi:two-component system, sensor histidine kinase YesM